MTKTPVTEEWKQNVDYELIPGDNNDWKVRILKGEFIETVFHYGNVNFLDEDMMMQFDFTLDYSPDLSVKSDNVELQKVASNILHSLLIEMLGTINDNKP
jgi:hypothetical protein